MLWGPTGEVFLMSEVPLYKGSFLQEVLVFREGVQGGHPFQGVGTREGHAKWFRA